MKPTLPAIATPKPAQEEKPVPPSPAKPPSSSFKIRIPALASRTAQTTTAVVSASPAGPRRSTRQRDTPSSSTSSQPAKSGATQTDTSTPKSSKELPPGTQAPALISIAPDELEALRAVRELMSVKGEKALLGWLAS